MEETQNRANEAKKSLKTKDVECYKVQKRTQNERKFERQKRELNPAFKVEKLDAKRSLDWLATLATLFPGTGHVPHLLLDTGGAHNERSQPRRGDLPQPRPTAWVTSARAGTCKP